VKGGKWFSLIDKVWKKTNLEAAWRRVKSNNGSGGVDGKTVRQIGMNWEKECNKLYDLLTSYRYTPQPIRRTWIPKPFGKEKRPLGIPTVRDRIVQTALRNVIEPIFEKCFTEHSYGFRPNRGCKDALRRVDALLREGYDYIVDADLKSYFDSIPHERLMTLIEEEIADGRVLSLIRGYLKQGVMDGMKKWETNEGTPQGAVISPLLANIYLNPLDHQMVGKGWEMIRYADDFVILCRTREEAEDALEAVRTWCREAGLTLHSEKTHITTAEEGFEFLGYLFKKGGKYPNERSKKKLRTKVRRETRRTDGRGLGEIITRLNPILRGWYNYFKHCCKRNLEDMDGWVRHRLRTILNKRNGRSRWKITQKDHSRWKNSFFLEQGLFSLAVAHAVERQSLK
jgi:RNA-directed DNA polymerase